MTPATASISEPEIGHHPTGGYFIWQRIGGTNYFLHNDGFMREKACDDPWSPGTTAYWHPCANDALGELVRFNHRRSRR